MKPQELAPDARPRQTSAAEVEVLYAETRLKQIRRRFETSRKRNPRKAEALTGGFKNQEAPTSQTIRYLIAVLAPPKQFDQEKTHSCEQVKCILDWPTETTLDQPWVQTQTTRQHLSADTSKEKLNPRKAKPRKAVTFRGAMITERQL